MSFSPKVRALSSTQEKFAELFPAKRGEGVLKLNKASIQAMQPKYSNYLCGSCENLR